MLDTIAMMVARSSFAYVLRVFALAAMVVGCSPSTSLEATGGFYPVSYAPGIRSGIKAIIDGGRSFEPEEGCFEKLVDSNKNERWAPRDFSHARGRLSSFERELADPLAYQSYGRVEIRNAGNQPVASLVFEGPLAGEFAVLARGEEVLGRFEQKIPVGTLDPGATATIRFWTSAPPSALRVGEQTRLTFAGGSAAIAYESETQGPVVWLSRRVSVWLLVNAAASLVLAVIVLAALRSRGARRA